MVQKTLQLIEDLKPRYWFIENPRGMLRKQWFMESLHRKTVTYCQYGDFRQKPTDIWTNAIHWCPRPCCRPGDPCHESAKRGSDKGTQNLNCAKERAKIPRELCLEVCRVCGEVGARQEVLSFACEAD